MCNKYFVFPFTIVVNHHCFWFFFNCLGVFFFPFWINHGTSVVKDIPRTPNNSVFRQIVAPKQAFVIVHKCPLIKNSGRRCPEGSQEISICGLLLFWFGWFGSCGRVFVVSVCCTGGCRRAAACRTRAVVAAAGSRGTRCSGPWSSASRRWRRTSPCTRPSRWVT